MLNKSGLIENIFMLSDVLNRDVLASPCERVGK